MHADKSRGRLELNLWLRMVCNTCMSCCLLHVCMFSRHPPAKCNNACVQEQGQDVDMQDVGSMRSAMKAMEMQLAQLKAQREAAEAEQVLYRSCLSLLSLQLHVAAVPAARWLESEGMHRVMHVVCVHSPRH